MNAHITQAVLGGGRHVKLILHTHRIVDGVALTDPEERAAIVAAMFELNHQTKEYPVTNPPAPLDLLGDDAMQLGHTINMVADLPRYMLDGTAAHGPALHPHVRHAIADSFAINARLLARFIHEQIHHRISDEDLAFLAELSETVNAHVITFGAARCIAPLVEIPARQWRSKLFELLDHVPLPEPLATWRANARDTADYISLDLLGEWKP